MLADGSAKGKADPAFPAHAMPIRAWAEAVWVRRLPLGSLKRMVEFAKNRLRKAKRQWSICYGPAAVFVATCNRLLWKVVDESTVVTDLGRTIHLDLDPPKVVEAEVDEAVRRWRWRRIVKHTGDEGSDIAGRGAFMEPIWRLLRSRQNDDEWNPVLRGSLRSAMANRQYPQCRVKAAGWSTHDRCLFCLNDEIEDSLGCCALLTRSRKIDSEGKAKSSRRDLASEASAEVMARTPKGTQGHRLYECPRLAGSRSKHASKELVEEGKANPGTLDFARAMKQRPHAPTTRRCVDGTFQWDVEPVGGSFEGTVYPDGSIQDGKFTELARGGWGFLVVSKEGKVVAAASGVPPEWITDIGGAEAWAIYQAARFAVPGGCRFISDSLTTVRSLQAGLEACTTVDKKYARVYRLCCEELDTTPAEDLVWMPAHKSRELVGKCRLSDGTLLTETHRDANGRADTLAKAAVEMHRVDSGVVERWQSSFEEATAAAKWIARATHEANNQEAFPFQDSEAASWKSDAAAAERRKAKRLRSERLIIIDRLKMKRQRRAPEQGGHITEKVHGGGRRSRWRCTVCKQKSGWLADFERLKCNGDPKASWAKEAVHPGLRAVGCNRSKLSGMTGLEDEAGDTAMHIPHNPVWSGEIIFCTSCGAYAESKAVKLKGS
jgi:hypothetical protein